MKKKIICAFLALVMIIGTLGVLASCGEETCTSHVDENNDGKCDKCGEKVENKVPTHTCEDKDGDDKCDECGKNLGSADHECVDEDGDDICDECGEDLGNGVTEGDYYWESVDFIYQMTNHSANGNFSSTCERYLAGEYTGVEEDIDIAVKERNENAKTHAKVGSVIYSYYTDTAQYGWGEACEVIMRETSSTDTEGLPDMYVNYLYDMVAASLQGCFANLYGTVRGQKENYFPFSEFRDAVDAETFDEVKEGQGYMYEFMTTLTLSKHRMYLLASNYYTDLVRAFFVMPVNIKLLEGLGKDPANSSLCEDLVGDDGAYTLDDFYQEVYNRTWTYNRVAELSNAVYRDTANPGRKDLGDTVGLAICSSGGLSSSGIVYSTACTIIERKWDSSVKDYTYSYPDTNDKLFDLFKSIDSLMQKPGVIVVSGTAEEKQIANGAPGGAECIEYRFATNNVLFGGIILVGTLEKQSYQNMKDDEEGGFGIVPVPLYSDDIDDSYLTQIHNEGRIGAISFKTTKFEQCTAYLNYLSTNSKDILEDYYKYKLQYGVLGEDAGTIDMMNYIRDNVRSAFDKTFEDAMGVFYDTSNTRWHNYLHENRFQVPEINKIYDELIDTKQKDLANLVVFYDTLKD